jgi:uncharacterized damage-inducible protein DinB
MTEQTSPLLTFYKQGWENHHRALVQTIAALSPEHLARPIAPHYISPGELLAHMIDARVSWFYGWMGEGHAELARWHEERSSGEQRVYEAASLVALFETTWQVIAHALERWTSADLDQLIAPPAYHQAWLRNQGLEDEPAHTRQWIVWHVLEHEIHHGGELSLALGTHGLDDFYSW